MKSPKNMVKVLALVALTVSSAFGADQAAPAAQNWFRRAASGIWNRVPAWQTVRNWRPSMPETARTFAANHPWVSRGLGWTAGLGTLGGLGYAAWNRLRGNTEPQEGAEGNAEPTENPNPAAEGTSAQDNPIAQARRRVRFRETARTTAPANADSQPANPAANAANGDARPANTTAATATRPATRPATAAANAANGDARQANTTAATATRPAIRPATAAANAANGDARQATGPTTSTVSRQATAPAANAANGTASTTSRPTVPAAAVVAAQQRALDSARRSSTSSSSSASSASTRATTAAQQTAAQQVVEGYTSTQELDGILYIVQHNKVTNPGLVRSRLEATPSTVKTSFGTNAQAILKTWDIMLSRAAGASVSSARNSTRPATVATATVRTARRSGNCASGRCGR